MNSTLTGRHFYYYLPWPQLPPTHPSPPHCCHRRCCDDDSRLWVQYPTIPPHCLLSSFICYIFQASSSDCKRKNVSNVARMGKHWGKSIAHSYVLFLLYDKLIFGFFLCLDLWQGDTSWPWGILLHFLEISSFCFYRGCNRVYFFTQWSHLLAQNSDEWSQKCRQVWYLISLKFDSYDLWSLIPYMYPLLPSCLMFFKDH